MVQSNIDLNGLVNVSTKQLAKLAGAFISDGGNQRYGWADINQVGKGVARGIWKRHNVNQAGVMEWSSYPIPMATNVTGNKGMNGYVPITTRISSAPLDVFPSTESSVNAFLTPMFQNMIAPGQSGGVGSLWTTLPDDEAAWTGFWLKIDHPTIDANNGFVKADSIQLVRIDDAIVETGSDPLTGDWTTNLEYVGRDATYQQDASGNAHITLSDNVGTNIQPGTSTGGKILDTPLYLRFNEDSTLAFKLNSKTPVQPAVPKASSQLGGVALINFPFSGV
jgi:hypothetical protein